MEFIIWRGGSNLESFALIFFSPHLGSYAPRCMAAALPRGNLGNWGGEIWRIFDSHIYGGGFAAASARKIYKGWLSIWIMKRVGIFSFTCCEGCVVVFIEALNGKYFEWKEKMKIENFRALKRVKKIGELDIAIVEGAISTESEVRKLKEIREKAKVLVAMGSGAVNGYPSNQRNKFSAKMKREIAGELERMGQLEKVLPLKEYVKVDVEIDGCPVDEGELIKAVDGLLG